MRHLIPMLAVCVLAGCGSGGVPADPNAAVEPVEKQEKISLSNPKFTTDIGKFDPSAGREVSDSKGTYSNPITGALEMYGPILERMSKMGIDRAVELFRATNGRYPKDYDEFMSKIVKQNNIKLPVLPGQLEYQYDEQNHKLVVVEKEKP